MTKSMILLALALCYLRSSHISSNSLVKLCAWRRMNPLTYTGCMIPPSGKDLQGDFPAKSRNGLTPMRIVRRITLCALPKAEPVGVQSINDDDDNE